MSKDLDIQSLMKSLGNFSEEFQNIPEQLKRIPEALADAQSKSGWRESALPTPFEHVSFGYAESIVAWNLFHYALHNSKHLHAVNCIEKKFKMEKNLSAEDKQVLIDTNTAKLYGGIVEAGLTKFFSHVSIGEEKYDYISENNVKQDYKSDIFVSEDSMVSISITEEEVTLQVYSFSNEVINKIRVLLDEFIDLEGLQSNLYVLTGKNLRLKAIGKPGIDLVKGNYSKQVVEEYNYVVKQLNNSKPFGRFIIINGVPGTGKTYLVKSLINSLDLNRSKFVYFPAELLHSIDFPMLMEVFTSIQGSSIILVIEDADDCLVTRQSDNISAISKLLNFADGLIGALLDVRVIATTNAKGLEIDKALLRPGRLCKRIEVKPLAVEQSNDVFNREIGASYGDTAYCTDVFTRPVTLAEVYEEVHKYHQAYALRKSK